MADNLYEFEKRSITIAKRKTTISMERIYWKLIEKIAAKRRFHWRFLVDCLLINKPADYSSRSGWLRFYATGYAYMFITRSPARKLHEVFGDNLRELAIEKLWAMEKAHKTK